MMKMTLNMSDNTFLPMIAVNVYKTGFKAELIGRTNTALQAYTSPDITRPDNAIKPEIVYCNEI
jgi:hypothetical protein